MIIKRQIEPYLKRIITQYPLVIITGPHQAGKSKLITEILPDYQYVSFTNEEVLALFADDPLHFLRQFNSPTIFAHVDQHPKILEYLLRLIDANELTNNFVLISSGYFTLDKKLAWQIKRITLLPLSLYELIDAKFSKLTLENYLLNGSYPQLYIEGLHPTTFYRNYVVHLTHKICICAEDKSHEFMLFLRVLAKYCGRVLQSEVLVKESGLCADVVAKWLELLKRNFIIFKLKPLYGNGVHRAPKLYFFDTGMLSYLLGLEKAPDNTAQVTFGAIFENFVISELCKFNCNLGLDLHFYYWRDEHDKEIDLIIDDGQQLKAVEIKSGRKLKQSYFTGLRYWQSLLKVRYEDLFVVYAGEESDDYRGLRALGWQACHEVLI